MAKESIMISVRLSPEDYAALLEKCQKRGINRSTYIREIIRYGAVYVVTRPHDLVLEISRVGNNLNQIVRQMNYGFLDGMTDDIHRIADDFSDLKRSAREITREVNKLCRY